MSKEHYDLVIKNGRVMNPESGLDSLMNIGINGRTIATIQNGDLSGDQVVNAVGNVVAPGFIDMHAHGQDTENYNIQCLDGVTTALELEVGASDIEKWYKDRENNASINFGVSVGHIPVRMDVMNDPGTGILPIGDAANKPASIAEISNITNKIEQGLKLGAMAVGMGLGYTPSASSDEIHAVFDVAAAYNATCHVHIRGEILVNRCLEALEEVITASVVTGASLHVVHLSSSGREQAPVMLRMIEDAQRNGLDVTTECYPYDAGMTEIGAATLGSWRSEFSNFIWADTVEQLNQETYEYYRENQPDGMVIMPMIPAAVVDTCVNSNTTAIASDGFLRNGTGHPRTAGTYSKVLGHFVREKGGLSLMDALDKMSLMPAQRLEGCVPSMRNKGRIAVGCDADIVIFDPDTVLDQATYKNPVTPSKGINFVVVNGTVVVESGKLNSQLYPGSPVRGNISNT